MLFSPSSKELDTLKQHLDSLNMKKESLEALSIKLSKSFHITQLQKVIQLNILTELIQVYIYLVVS